jgi:CRISPR type IV-associated protein Csf2
MRTYVFEGVVTALSSICHNGGEKNGITSQLRREKFVQPNGKAKEVPVISGNAIRGILRDRGMFSMLQRLGYGVNEDSGEVKGLPLNAFYFLFSGGALTSTGEDGLNVDFYRKMKDTIPLIGLFGGAAGNSIMPGKIKVGKLIPICNETAHLIPERFLPETVESIWEYCQTEMYTRRDDAKNDKLRPMLPASERKPIGKSEEDTADKPEKRKPQQMMYHAETLSAGTKFYWKIIAEDVTDIEFEALIITLLEFSRAPYIGGKSAVGLGEIAIKMDKWLEIDSRIHLEGKEVDVQLGKKYEQHIKNNEQQIRDLLEAMK